MDESQVRLILDCLDGVGSVEQLLLNDESFSGMSILHAAVALPRSDNKSRIVKALIAAGVDCDRRDQSGLTACECALEILGDRELAELMIETEMERLAAGGDRAFYVMIRRGSVAVLQLFLKVGKLDAANMFGQMSNAMIELNVKRVDVKKEMKAFVEYQLAEYAFRNLSGDMSGRKDVNEWRKHFKLVADNWKILKENYGDEDYAKIDDEFVHRVQTIHNHLYFIKDKRFMRHSPMMETVFCLAMFVSIFKWPESYPVFRMLINKLNIMQFLRVICAQLVQVERCLNSFAENLKVTLDQCVVGDALPSKDQIMTAWMKNNPGAALGENIANKIVSGCKKKLNQREIVDDIVSNENFEMSPKINGRDRSILAKLRRCYFRSKQLYSLHKCNFKLQGLSAYAAKKTSRSDVIMVPTVKRVIQEIGEAIKSTKNSPNIPKKIEVILQQMLSDLFLLASKNFREFLSHKYSLAKQYIFVTSEALYYNAIANHLGHVEMIFSLLYVCSIEDANRSLLGSMRRCKTIDQLRSLIQYVGDVKEAELSQVQQFGKVEFMFKKMQETILSAKVPKEDGPGKIIHLKQAMKMKEMVLTRFREGFQGKKVINFESIKLAVLGGAELQTVYRMIELSLTFFGHGEAYEQIRKYWLSDHVVVSSLEMYNTSLVQHNPTAVSGILKVMENKLRLIQEKEYLENTRRILNGLEVNDPPQDLLDSLHKQLLKYYENIFFVDNKYKVIKQVFKSRKLPLNEAVLKNMRTQDEESLQKIYDGLINNMQQILQTSQVFTVQDVFEKFDQSSIHIMTALEYLQLELCEILITVGYFGDNFHLLKHRMPLINGRNYRNYLAHDTLSYNALTDSTRIKLIINSLVLVKCPVKLFGKSGTSVPCNFQFPDTEEMQKWVLNQKVLANSIRTMDFETIHSSLDDGADLSGLYSGPNGMFEPLKFNISSVDLVNPNASNGNLRKVVELLEPLFPKPVVKVRSPAYGAWYALQMRDFATAFQIFKEHQPLINLALPQNFFYWSDLVEHLPQEFLICDDTDQLMRTFLHRFTLSGNIRGVEKLLEINPDTNLNVKDAHEETPLDISIRYGFVQISKLLLSKNPTISEGCQQFAVITHLNEFLPQLFINFDQVLFFNEVYIRTAVRADNRPAVEFISNHLYRGSYACMKSKHFPSLLSLAAYLDRFSIIQYLLTIANVDYFTEAEATSGNSALQHSIRRRNWPTVKLLLDHGASPNWITPDVHQPLKTAFQLAVKADSRRVLRLMEKIDRKLYRFRLIHPLVIAFGNDSSVMARYLQRLGFSLLDCGQILPSAVKTDGLKFVDEIFRALDDSIGTCKASEGLLEEVTQLLCRWKAFMYFETPGTTGVSQAVSNENWDVMSQLLEKSGSMRKVNDHQFLKDVQFYSKQDLLFSYADEGVRKVFEIYKHCEMLIDRLKTYERCTKLKIDIAGTSKSHDSNFNCYLVKHSDESSIDPDEISSLFKPDLYQQYMYQSIMKLLENTQDGIIGAANENSTQLLSYFVIFGDICCVLQLSLTELPQPLMKLVNLNTVGGETPLHLIATRIGALEPMKILLGHGANPLNTDSAGVTPLHLSLTTADDAKAMYLLNYCLDLNLKSPSGVPALNFPDGQGLTPLHYAAIWGKLDAVRQLVSLGADIRAQDVLGLHPANYALSNDHLKVLRLLLDRDPTLVHIADRRGQTLLHYSVERREENAILMLLEYDADLSRRDRDGNTAIDLAVERVYVGWVKIVLFYARMNAIRGLLDNYPERGMPILGVAVFFNKPELLRALVEYEIDSDLDEDLTDGGVRKLQQVLKQKTDDEGFTALHIAVQFGFLESVKFILHCQARHNHFSERKTNLAQDVVDLQGNTPLDYALRMQNEEVLNILLNGQ